jgi:apolipoprotein N-acyltransferase
MNRWTVLITVLVVCGLVWTGCSGGGDPVSQTPEPQVTGATTQDSTQTQLLGYYDIYLRYPNSDSDAGF